VFAQNYATLDYVVVNGNPQMGVVTSIAGRADRLAWWCSEPDCGMYDALNKGFAHTRGEIMGWLDSDDLLLPGALRAVGEIFARYPEVEWSLRLALSTWTIHDNCAGVSAIEGFSRAAFLDGGYLPGAARQYGWIPKKHLLAKVAVGKNRRPGGRILQARRRLRLVEPVLSTCRPGRHPHSHWRISLTSRSEEPRHGCLPEGSPGRA
jgi:glycosyltransferase involved in cell wall biosynthesis